MKYLAVLGLALMLSVPAVAGDGAGSKEIPERAMREAKEVHDRIEHERETAREAREHPSPHEGRVSVSEHVSVGGDVKDGRVEVNVRVDTK